MSERFLARPLTILLVEDSEPDLVLTQEAFEAASVPVDLVVAKDGRAALDLLDEVAHGDRPMPDLILLDLNLPKIGGLEVLVHIKSHPALKVIPVLVMSVSSSPGDLRAAYERHANSFIPKPIDPKQFVDVVRTLDHYWATVARLPSRD